MLFRPLIVEPADHLKIIFNGSAAEDDQTAIVGLLRRCCNDPVREIQSGFAVLRRVDTVIRKWSSQCDLASGIARRRSKSCPVSGQHRGSRKKGLIVRWILTDRCSLVAAEEKQLVLQN